MTITTFSSSEFNQNINEAKRAASSGSVFITDRGKPTHVLLSFEEYQRLIRPRRNIADVLSMKETVDFKPLRAEIELNLVDYGNSQTK